ncbi:fructosamine kinase family protein [Thiomicrospira microaerophila]|uniref:fructosamine kinase family protein n=1 Tax=Thiomicrospira microaerophila TaxID=406020 RepID=UPI0020103C61|nr:fructosamine kinase family protein [Thiomicrospira microaerophila]UQB42250.1 fructosamine kinase family protein [Thiomicrospira microaerophila]
MLSDSLIHSLNNSLNQTLELQNITPVAGGDIHQAWLLETSQAKLFLKLNRAQSAPVFAAEAWALQHIQQSQTIRCPQVIALGQTDQQAWLLMEYIALSGRGDDFKRGQALAAMHQTQHSQFGWEQDNFIGHTPQRNTWTQEWLDFYRQQRLEPQLALAKQQGASQRLIEKGQQLAENLAVFFEHYQPVPSLLHGDLWAGNSAFSAQGEPVIYDPASYYGDRETDIAMTELFGGFSPAFYQGYNQAWPLDASYQQRKPLYNLYHILNHFNLFGGHYQHQAEQLITQLLANR